MTHIIPQSIVYVPQSIVYVPQSTPHVSSTLGFDQSAIEITVIHTLGGKVGHMLSIRKT